MKILITGSNGLLGQKLLYKLRIDDSVDLVATSKGENRVTVRDGYAYHSLDITNKAALEELISTQKPDVVINTAAMTNVDLCEDKKESCDVLNVDAVQYLANACARIDAQLIHISTDFIFDGEDGPYTEEDMPNPLSYYGLSKLKSEQLLQVHSVKWTILRTIIVFGVGENLSKGNIVLWAKEALAKGDSLNIIDDQFRAPTLAEDLADICILAAKKKALGIFNASGKDIMSIYEIVERVAKYYGNSTNNLNKISTATLNQKAVRPPKTGFILDKSINELGYRPHSFEECLAIMDEQLKTIH
ncbi:MAG: NAD(P)-dependent oxidoreductase [Flavobacteriales bacterium TMED123]|nr:MAG: NAD(P)-dependent oxidoreductase [Flavobacteriales bacterium TMED123]|tara:strand:- start:4937 stop:5842 length:906 start_codon:yes stop_codon:yes gene_type:complete